MAVLQTLLAPAFDQRTEQVLVLAILGRMPFAVTFEQLHTFENGRQLPLAKVDTQYRTHIHGALHITVGARELPYLGYFGASDVCIGMWIDELVAATRAVSQHDPAEHLFDEGEQGQPAFLFRREGGQIYVSVVDSALSDTPGDSEWQRVACTVEEFTTGIDLFLQNLRSTLEKEMKPAAFDHWWKRHTKGE
jgi:hypothetical protein